MVEVSEQYLNIAEPFEYDSSVSKIVYLTQDPRIGTDLNASQQTIITINPTDDWLLPSKSYIYVEGRILKKADNTRFTKINGNWPDIALTNNFFPYLYNTIRYTVNDVEVESFNYPGQCTTIKHLLTKPNNWTASDIGWEIDTYNGSSVRSDVQYYPVSIPSSVFPGAVPDPDAAEYRAAFRLIITTFNEVNSTAVANPTDAQLPCAGANPTAAEMLSSAQRILTNINAVIDVDTISLPAGNIFTAATSAAMRTGLQTLLSIINGAISSKDYSGLKKNMGFIRRKEYIFNTTPNVMPDDQAGNFSFRIPVDHLFNFCENYNKVMYNCKHELLLNRETDSSAALFKTISADEGKIQIDLMRWYMPKITPNEQYKAMLYKQIGSGIEVDMAFMNKKIDFFNQMGGLSTYSVTLNYAAGIEKPRYIVAAFQSVDINATVSPAANYNTRQNVNYSIFNSMFTGEGNGTAGSGNPRNVSMIDVNYVNVYINGDNYQLMDYNNNSNQNRMARWYNEYKKFKMSYSNNFSEDDMISYESFRNLYRLYVFDISKQSEVINNGITNVRLEFNFNQPIPAATECEVNLYCVSFFDRIWRLKSDGTKQYILK